MILTVLKMQNNVSVYPFTLEFDGGAACFPFIFDGTPAAGLSCMLSARSAGDMRFDSQAGVHASGLVPGHLHPAADGRVPGRSGVHGPVREAFFRSRGIDPEKVYSLFQVHSRDVYSIGDPVREQPPFPGERPFPGEQPFPGERTSPSAFARQGDGMVSFCRDVFLAVTVADCLPVFLLDTENLFFAALHSGWRGTGIVCTALDIMKKAGTRPEAVAAVLGPCIQGCCYKVDEGRASDFEKEFGGSAGPLGNVVLRRDDGPYISLQAANARLLAGAGVRHIAVCEDCTYTDERLGSYRREGPAAYTRMAAMAGPFGAI
jgi:YfiH family protein